MSDFPCRHFAGQPFALLGAIALLMLGLHGPANAQQDGAPKPAKEMAANMAGEAQALRGEIQSLQQDLEQVQKEALQDNEGLQSQRQSLVNLMESKLAQADPKAEDKVARMRAIRGEIQSETLDQSARQALIAEFRGLQQALQQTQQQMLQDPDVVKQQTAFQQAMTTAMVERDPSVEGKIDELESLIQEYRQLVQGS